MQVDLYADWAPTYPPCAHNALMEVEQATVLDLLPSVAGCDVLDAGCGTGRYARLLRERGARRVIGVDLSRAMLQRADRSSDRVGGDLRALPLVAGAVDVVVSGLAILDIPELALVAAEWRRVLRRGGVVVYSTLHPVGASLGWTRTFDTPRGRRTLPACWHTMEEHRRACAAAALAIDRVIEPSVDGRTPAALVIRAQAR